MTLEPGMRVRCVDAGGNGSIVNGCEYVIRNKMDAGHGAIKLQLWRGGIWYIATRFKPVVRVKARSQRIATGQSIFDGCAY